ncbi:hypothetical protein Hdeb2414_s0614g00924501 [Helianthus debilis subsp. tardiflorus]
MFVNLPRIKLIAKSRGLTWCPSIHILQLLYILLKMDGMLAFTTSVAPLGFSTYIISSANKPDSWKCSKHTSYSKL